MKIAVLDLGTNTFNLLIVEKNNQNFSVLYADKLPVKIGEGSFKSKVLTPEAIKRGILAIEQHLQTIKKLKIEKIYGFATSALRSAKNGVDFKNQIFEKFKINIEIIDGEKEAFLIYTGIKNAVDWNEDAILMDIGGGSTEILIANKNKVLFSHSFDLGVSRLLEMLSFSNPVTKTEVNVLNEYLKEQLKPLLTFKIQNIKTIIGSAGTFDSLASIHQHKINFQQSPSSLKSYQLSTHDFLAIHYDLLNKTTEQRKQIAGLLPYRAEMIHIGSLLVYFIINQFNCEKIIQSEYSLKEGVIFGQLNTTNG